ncbi:MAG: zinc-binding dehydrogenase [Armatimonadia bacterium]|nr:zinc-binding dehydrogenase [Armatimonadia bacterium]
MRGSRAARRPPRRAPSPGVEGPVWRPANGVSEGESRMKVLAIEGPRRSALHEVTTPRPVGDWALVRVTCAPMCTEFKGYREGRVSEGLGHEAVGVVEAVAQEGPVQPGNRVVVMPQYPCGQCTLCLTGDYIHCEHSPDFVAKTGGDTGQATMAQYLIKPMSLLVPIPDEMPDEHAGMACCGLGPTFSACDRLGLSGMDTVLITGLGPVGLGGVINAKHRGSRVIAIDPVAYRRELAASLGADHVLEPTDVTLEHIRDLCRGRGVDKAIECAGVAAAQRLCIDALRRRGEMAFVAEAGDLVVKVSQDLIRKGLTVHGVWHYNMGRTPAMMEQITEMGVQLDQLITHRFPMSGADEAFELQMTGECGKVVLDPWS